MFEKFSIYLIQFPVYSLIYFLIFLQIMGIQHSNLEEYQLPQEFKPIPTQPNIYRSVLDHSKLTKYEVQIPNYADLNHQYSTSIFRKCNSQHIVGPKYFYPYDMGLCNSNYIICYFIQYIDYRLSDIRQFNNLSQAFIALISILEGSLILIKKYNYFLLTSKMVYFCQNKLKIWISQKVIDRHVPQHLIAKTQNDMVKSIINIIDSRISINQLYDNKGKGQKIKKKIEFKKKCRIFQEFIENEFKDNLQLQQVLSYLILYAEEFQMFQNDNKSHQKSITKKQKHRFHHSGDIYIKHKNEDRKFSIKKQIGFSKTSCWMEKKESNIENSSSKLEKKLGKQSIGTNFKQQQANLKLGFKDSKHQKKLKKVKTKNMQNFREKLITVTDEIESQKSFFTNFNVTKVFNQSRVPTNRIQPITKRTDRVMQLHTTKVSPRASPQRKTSFVQYNKNQLISQLHTLKNRQIPLNHTNKIQPTNSTTKIIINYNNRKSQDIYDRKTSSSQIDQAKRFSFQRNTINQNIIQQYPICFNYLNKKKQIPSNIYSVMEQKINDISKEKAFRQRADSTNSCYGQFKSNLTKKIEPSIPNATYFERQKQNEQKNYIKRKSITKNKIENTQLFSNKEIYEKQNNHKKTNLIKKKEQRASIETDLLNLKNNNGFQDQYVLVKGAEMKKIIDNLKAEGNFNSVVNYLTTIKSIKMSDQQLCSYLDVQFMNSLKGR